MTEQKRVSLDEFAAGALGPVEPIIDEDGNVFEYESMFDEVPPAPAP